MLNWQYRIFSWPGIHVTWLKLYAIGWCKFETYSRLCMFVWDFFEAYKRRLILNQRGVKIKVWVFLGTKKCSNYALKGNLCEILSEMCPFFSQKAEVNFNSWSWHLSWILFQINHFKKTWVRLGEVEILWLIWFTFVCGATFPSLQNGKPCFAIEKPWSTMPCWKQVNDTKTMITMFAKYPQEWPDH